MSRVPDWFGQLKWSRPSNIAQVVADRSMLPVRPGIYVFSEFCTAPEPGRVLYVGMTKQPLRARLRPYIKDYKNSKPSGRKNEHLGKLFIWDARENRGDHGIYLQWIEYYANVELRARLEASLIHYLNPSCNARDDDEDHALLGDEELLEAETL